MRTPPPHRLHQPLPPMLKNLVTINIKMKGKLSMEKIPILVTILIMTLSLTCNAQNNTDNQKFDTLKV